jgi:hypothetical protein
LTSTLDGVEWSASRLGRFIPEKRAPVPTGWEVGWIPEPVWTLWSRKNPLPGIEPQLFNQYTMADEAVPTLVRIMHCSLCDLPASRLKLSRTGVSLARSEVITAVTLNIIVTPCILVDEYQRSGTCRFRLKIFSALKMEAENTVCYFLENSNIQLRNDLNKQEFRSDTLRS